MAKKRKWPDLTGRRFGRLTVLGRTEVPHKLGRFWSCKCDCGKKTAVVTAALHSGNTTSCGCYRTERQSEVRRKPFGVASFNALLLRYKTKARQRGLSFNLSKSDFRQLTQKNCHYCGSPPHRNFTAKQANGPYVYTGIDRVDPTSGYTPENVVPCCTRCNTAKATSGYEDFRDWIQAVFHQWAGENDG